MKQRLALAFWRCACLAALVTCLYSADWPRFRGPNGSGVAEAEGLPIEFGRDRNLLWKADIPQGQSSPIIAGDRIYLSAYEDDQRLVLCLDRQTGKQLWRRAVAKRRDEVATKPNDAATSSPTSDGINVYAFFPEFGLISYGPEGRERWRAPLGPFVSVHGLASSPVYAEGMIFLLVDQTQDSYLAAYDAESGRQRWKVKRGSGMLGGYSTPAIYEPADGPPQVVTAGPFELAGYQLDTGEKLWWAQGFTNTPVALPVIAGDALYLNEPWAEPPGFNVMLGADKNKDGKLSPEEMDTGMARFIAKLDQDHGDRDGLVDAPEWQRAFAAQASNGGLIALSLDGRGDISESALRWRIGKSMPFIPSVVVYEDVLYAVRDGGILTAVNPANGEILKQGRLTGAIDKYYSSPVAADGKLFLVSESGKVAVVEAGPDWQILAVNDLGQESYSTPAIASGHVYIRAGRTLFCFGKG